MNARILMIEDDKELVRLMQLGLRQHGYECLFATNGAEGLRLFEEREPDLVILDIALPRMNGLEVCQRIRTTSNVPIMMMSAHAVTEDDIAHGLNLGADEYILKPFGNVSFYARLRALLRRSRPTEDIKLNIIVDYEDEYLRVEIESRRVYIRGEEIRLTPTEFKLLTIFLQHSGEILTFQQLLERVWGYEYTSEHHYPRIYVSHLRRKIEPDLKNPTYIQNEYGVGYRFTPQNHLG
jgi:two-component system, OmpR family, KDP operon response regulator KdpE